MGLCSRTTTIPFAPTPSCSRPECESAAHEVCPWPLTPVSDDRGMTSKPASLATLFTLLIGIVAPAAAQSGPSSPLPTVQPRLTFVDPPTPKAAEIIAWAVDRFRDAGLQLPDLEISFPTSCEGKKALYHVGRSSIDFCYVINKTTVLHEFAHAWDDTSGAVDRNAFLKMRGLSVWWGGPRMPSDEQGAEHVAEIIARGLMNVDTRSVPQLPANSLSELTEAFVMLTRGVQPWPTRPNAPLHQLAK
jgi:hypothetical protein